MHPAILAKIRSIPETPKVVGHVRQVVMTLFDVSRQARCDHKPIIVLAGGRPEEVQFHNQHHRTSDFVLAEQGETRVDSAHAHQQVVTHNYPPSSLQKVPGPLACCLVQDHQLIAHILPHALGLEQADSIEAFDWWQRPLQNLPGRRPKGV